MKAALELGRWVFLAPIGYLNAPRAMGKSLMPDPERAPLVRRAFEEYATGRFTKQQAAQAVKSLGLDQPARPSAHVASDRRAAAKPALRRHRGRPEYGVRAKRGDFEPLISEDLFYRVQAVLSGSRAEHDATAAGAPGLPTARLRALRVLWSRPHRQLVEGPQRVLTRTTTAALAAARSTSRRRSSKDCSQTNSPDCSQRQATCGYDGFAQGQSVLQIWKARKAAVREELATAERAAKAIQDKLDRLDEAFLFERSIDIETYDRHAEKSARGAHARPDRPSLRPAR